MNNEIELNDEQLAEVTGGSSFDYTRFDIDASKTASNTLFQGNIANANTFGIVNGGGKNSTTLGSVTGAQFGQGNTAVLVNNQ